MTYFFECSVCGDEAMPNPPPWAFLRAYSHLYEWSSWKGTREPPGGWREYDHRAKPPKRKKRELVPA